MGLERRMWRCDKGLRVVRVVRSVFTGEGGEDLRLRAIVGMDSGCSLVSGGVSVGFVGAAAGAHRSVLLGHGVNESGDEAMPQWGLYRYTTTNLIGCLPSRTSRQANYFPPLSSGRVSREVVRHWASLKCPHQSCQGSSAIPVMEVQFREEVPIGL